MGGWVDESADSGSHIYPSIHTSTHPHIRSSVTVSMHCIGRKGGQAHRDVFGAAGAGTAIANPFARMRHDGLAGVNVKRAPFVLHAQHPAEHDGDFFKGGPLTWLDPTLGRRHPGHADRVMTRVDAPSVFLDAFGLVPGGGDNGRMINQCRHTA